MRSAVVVAAFSLALAGCDRTSDHGGSSAAGEALEVAARSAGLVADSASAAGVFAAGDDRVCVTGAGPRYRIGVSVDYGVGQRCVARGTASGGRRLSVDLGADCRFRAERDGDALAFPATLPAPCASLCEGRASLEALAVQRLSAAAGEAVRTRGADGQLLCTD